MRNLIFPVIFFFSAISSFAQVLDLAPECEISVIERIGDTIIATGNRNYYFENAFLAGDSCWNHGVDGFWRIFSLKDTASLVFEAKIVNGKFTGTVKSFVGDEFERVAQYNDEGVQLSATEKHFSPDTTINQAFKIPIDFENYIRFNTNAIVFLYTDRTRLRYILLIRDKYIETLFRFNEAGILEDEIDYKNGKEQSTKHLLSN